jgi:hypothetical protein
MFQTTNQSILWGTGKKMLGNEELHFTPGKPRFPQILQGLGARNRWKFSSLGPGSMQLDQNEKHTISGNRLPHHTKEPWSYYSVCKMIIIYIYI